MKASSSALRDKLSSRRRLRSGPKPLPRAPAPPQFIRYIGINYSGDATSTTPLEGLQVFQATQQSKPVLVRPGAGAHRQRGKRYWTRKGLALWLVQEISKGEPIIIGMDHAFSFPVAYLKRYKLNRWDEFLVDFCRHWPTHRDRSVVDLRREPARRRGGEVEYRLTEERAASAMSVFDRGDVPAWVKASYAGIPWLLHIRQDPLSRGKVHFWPFDGFVAPPEKAVIAEVHPASFPLAFHQSLKEGKRTLDQQNAFAIADFLQTADDCGFIRICLAPRQSAVERSIVGSEGWMLGIDPPAIGDGFVLRSGYEVLREKDIWHQSEHLTNALLGEAMTASKLREGKGWGSVLQDIKGEIEYFFSQFADIQSMRNFGEAFLGYHVWKELLRIQERHEEKLKRGLRPISSRRPRIDDLRKYFMSREDFSKAIVLHITQDQAKVLLDMAKDTRAFLMSLGLQPPHIDIAREMMRGARSYQAIADNLGATVENVKYHAKRMLRLPKVHAADRGAFEAKLVKLLGSRCAAFKKESPSHFPGRQDVPAD